MIVHRIVVKVFAIIAINLVGKFRINHFINLSFLCLGHVSRDCTEPRSNNYNSGGGGGGGFRGGRGKKTKSFLSKKNCFIFNFKAVVAAAVAEVIVTDAPNQAISHVIVLNQIHVVIPINKVSKMIR